MEGNLYLQISSFLQFFRLKICKNFSPLPCALHVPLTSHSLICGIHLCINCSGSYCYIPFIPVACVPTDLLFSASLWKVIRLQNNNTRQHKAPASCLTNFCYFFHLPSSDNKNRWSLLMEPLEQSSVSLPPSGIVWSSTHSVTRFILRQNDPILLDIYYNLQALTLTISFLALKVLSAPHSNSGYILKLLVPKWKSYRKLVE